MGAAAAILEPPRPFSRGSDHGRSVAFSSPPPRGGRGERRSPRGRPERWSLPTPGPGVGGSRQARSPGFVLVKLLVIAIGALLLLVGPMASSVAAVPAGHAGCSASARPGRALVATNILPAGSAMGKLCTEASLPKPAM